MAQIRTVLTSPESIASVVRQIQRNGGQIDEATPECEARSAEQGTALMRALGLAYHWQRLLGEQRAAPAGGEKAGFGGAALARPGPSSAPTLTFRAKKIPTDKGWDFGKWWRTVARL